VNRRFSEEQIRGYLAEAAGGASVRELCARYGFSDASFYGWRARYGSSPGGEGREGRKIRELEQENARLKSMLADALLKIEVMRSRPRRGGAPNG
jgi:putative transposase